MSLTRCSARSPSASSSRRSLSEIAGGLDRLSVSVLGMSRCFRHDLKDALSDRPPQPASHRKRHDCFALRNGLEHVNVEALPQSADLFQETLLRLPAADKTRRENTDDL